MWKVSGGLPPDPAYSSEGGVKWSSRSRKSVSSAKAVVVVLSRLKVHTNCQLAHRAWLYYSFLKESNITLMYETEPSKIWLRNGSDHTVFWIIIIKEGSRIYQCPTYPCPHRITKLTLYSLFRAPLYEGESILSDVITERTYLNGITHHIRWMVIPSTQLQIIYKLQM